MSVVYDILHEAGQEEAKARLKKVWTTWREFGVITNEVKWRQIGQCFLKAEEKKNVVELKTKAAGIGRNVSALFGYFSLILRALLT